MIEWVTDGYVVVKSHGKEDALLNRAKAVDEEHLSQGAIQANVNSTKSKDSQQSGDSGSGQNQVNDSL